MPADFCCLFIAGNSGSEEKQKIVKCFGTSEAEGLKSGAQYNYNLINYFIDDFWRSQLVLCGRKI